MKILVLILCTTALGTIQVNLKSNWKDTPLLYETLSYLNEYNNELLLPFFEGVVEKNVFNLRGEKAYDTFIELLPENNRKLIELALSLRSQSPFVVASNSVNISCNGIIRGNKCSLSGKEEEGRFEYERYLLYLTKQTNATGILIIPQENIKEKFNLLKQLMKEKVISSMALFLKPSLSEGIKDGIITPLDTMNLTGYDIEIMHRNFKREFGIIKEKEDYIYLKDWNNEDLRIGMMDYLLNDNEKLISKKLINITQEFPLSIISLLKRKNERLKIMSENIREVTKQIMLINGISFNLQQQSIYDFIDILQKEDNKINELKNYELPTNLFISSLHSRENKETIRFLIPSEHIIKINSFDSYLYERFPKQLESFFQYNPYQLFRFTSQDLYTFIATLDFNNLDQTLYSLKVIQTFMFRYLAPLQFGIIPINIPTNEIGQILLSSIIDINNKWGNDGLMKFIEKVDELQINSVSQITNFFEKFYRSRVNTFEYNINNYLNNTKIISTINYMNNHGFKSNAFYLNGIFIDHEKIFSEFSKIYSGDIPILQELIRTKQLHDGNIYSQLQNKLQWIKYIDTDLMIINQSSIANWKEPFNISKTEDINHVITLCGDGDELKMNQIIEKLYELHSKEKWKIIGGMKNITENQIIENKFKTKEFKEIIKILKEGNKKEICDNANIIFDSVKIKGNEYLEEQIKIVLYGIKHLSEKLKKDIGINKLGIAMHLILLDSLTTKRVDDINKSPLTVRQIANDINSVKYNIKLIIDPIMREAQKVGKMLQILEELYPNQINIEMILIKTLGKGGDFPCEYYYSNIPFKPTFNNNQRKDQDLIIQSLPKNIVFQLKIITAQNIDTLLTNTTVDIDNFKNNDTIMIEYSLTNLVIETTSQSKVYIGNEYRYNTINVTGDNGFINQGVLSKGGYFQTLVPPGIYSTYSNPSMYYKFITLNQPLEVLNFRFTIHELSFQPIPLSLEEKNKMNELNKNKPSNSNSFINNLFGRNKKEESPIEIFTIAGGKDYERTVKILIYSVKKNTKSPLKFWLIEDFLSPEGRITLKEYGKALGVTIEYCRFHWPYFMFKQVSKTRIIWANKILFLDMMFPQSVDKIIFMDSDQVTRADAKELWNFDIQNNAIAMTPFCDGEWLNKETVSYRFWYHDSWRYALQSRPYHISALFIADLKVFRTNNVGEQYRTVYNDLTLDPNNLANLDQDLPNYVQKYVPIFSLPQEWLWCESWCNQKVKSKAKTIDLCNNPIKPLGKIESALKNIEEWKSYDEIVHGMEEKVNNKKEL
ncbi:UDP-glucose glycoprotein:glucosyltransferase, putative [Entamoeba dispar SAW760]|uniref:UDP-glucose glycoprotein:glucosyltransferase, putative n=1 Tax=Entamoeba dispar (strain ATCC PRA-260 / SAW760) TaxID=370354 RepID=B0EHK3_ENTDS|nr:UDP-glucose glycoprotein:glucosyltransferase, putative [Entamoeba dispar SAW760]EDR26001.1 UDP-glucose glycoprotein:glucosyltransferase, putative [Entamoeba dispar SAW760]|eukprot:EDR26001.1 UDP-glucose glycoprotein:glucosyltransferase, putative [Entamoeba dispar SAW760]